MLFRTVYGPELEAIYVYLSEHSSEKTAIPLRQVYAMFLADEPEASTQPVDDALSFLVSTGLVHESRTNFYATQQDNEPFVLLVLKALRGIESGHQEAQHPLDPLYSLILNEVFIRPNLIFVGDLHTRVNDVRQVKEMGGLSKEKIQAWKRVMEFLGVGQRAFGGFMCAYSPNLLGSILGTWGQARSTLQAFFEHHVAQYLPYAGADGEVASAVAVPLTFLEESQAISLFAMQDSPSKTYFGNRRLRGIGVN